MNIKNDEYGIADGRMQRRKDETKRLRNLSAEEAVKVWMSEDYADSDEQALMHAVRRGTKKLLLNKCRTRTGVRMTEAQIRKFISDAMGGEEEPGALLGIY